MHGSHMVHTWFTQMTQAARDKAMPHFESLCPLVKLVERGPVQVKGSPVPINMFLTSATAPSPNEDFLEDDDRCT